MNTDRLIDLLSANLEPVKRGQLGKTLGLAMVVGGVAAFGLMLTTVGPRSLLESTTHLEWTAAKLLFALSIICTGAPFLMRAIRPGREDEAKWAFQFFPLAAAITLTVVILLFGLNAWGTPLGAMELSSARCIFCVPFFAAIPFAALIWALRQGAPTRLELCGAIAGIVVGGLGAAAYALACNKRYGSLRRDLVQRGDYALWLNRSAPLPQMVNYVLAVLADCRPFVN